MNNEHIITNQSLALSMVLVLVAILVSYRKSWRWKKTSSGVSAGGGAADHCRLRAEVYFQR